MAGAFKQVTLVPSAGDGMHLLQMTGQVYATKYWWWGTLSKLGASRPSPHSAGKHLEPQPSPGSPVSWSRFPPAAGPGTQHRGHTHMAWECLESAFVHCKLHRKGNSSSKRTWERDDKFTFLLEAIDSLVILYRIQKGSIKYAREVLSENV